ncbi:MAG TPA: type II toxin-antitoxin system VapC family toxin [Candidatus Limnocylindria bacterium]|nr:type II toxin-antitoxin system VapC family toxin [Candidatus Limnocylindria bacterium]
MTTVVDASVVVKATLAEAGFDVLSTDDFVAPPLLWSEVSSVLHGMQWRSAISPELARIAADRLDSSNIRSRRPRRLRAEAWSIADHLGWAKTYDAEYVALASLLGCQLMTIDARLQQRAGHLVDIIGPL